MWRQMIRILPKKINSVCYKLSRRTVVTRANPLTHSVFLLSAAQVVIDHIDISDDQTCINENNIPITEIDDLQLRSDIEITYAESGEAIKNLIKTLHACIQEICDQYQHCIAKQIEITMACMELEPVGPHWDELTKYRVLADDLRLELIKYRTLIATIGSIVQTVPFNGQDKRLPEDSIVTVAYQSLVDLIETKVVENNTWDAKLTDVHTQSILINGLN